MRFLMGSQHVQWPQQLRDWLLHPRNKAVLADLWRWCEEKETQGEWGNVDVYFETELPPAGKSGPPQVDLLIAFDDRAAMCEIKQYSSLRMFKREHDLDQIQRQDLALEAIRRRVHVGKASRVVMFCPLLDEASVLSLSREVSLAHIVVTGGAACAHTTGFPRYLPRTLAKLLSELAIDGTHWRIALYQFIENHNRQHLQKCRSIAETIDFLNRLEESGDTRISADQVDGLRASSLAAAARQLQDNRLLEICGAHWIGKSRFADELARAHLKNYTLLPLELHGASTPAGILRQALERANRSHDRIEDAHLIPASDELRVVYWIQSYDRPAAAALSALTRLLAAHPQPAALDSAKWIVESVVPIAPPAGRIQLEDLDAEAIRTILLRTPPGEGTHDLIKVAYSAQGNPGIACALWKSEKPPASRDQPVTTGVQELGWLSSILSAFELLLLRYIIWLLSTMPSGVSLTLLRALVADTFPEHPVTERNEALRRVVKTIKSNQFGHVYTVDAWLLPVEFHEDAFDVVNNIALDLLADVRGWLSTHPSFLTHWRSRTLKALEREAREPLSLAYGARSLQTGDLWNFFWHPFRTTHRSHVVRWLDDSEVAPILNDALSIYVARALRVGHGISEGTIRADQFEAELGGPGDQSDARYAAVYQSLKFSTIRQLHLDDSAVEEWRLAAEQIADPSVRLPALAHVALAFGQAGNPEAGWSTLKPALEERSAIPENHRIRLLRSGLAFLNQTHLLRELKPAESNEYFRDLTVQVACELLTCGTACHNVTLVSDGFFYLTRAQDFYKVASIDRRQAIGRLRFVTGASPGRALQAVLTEGSLYRRACRDGLVNVEEVPNHLTAAARLYEQTFQSASSLRLQIHELNAASYLGEVALIGMRHAASNRDVVGDWLRTILDLSYRIVSATVANIFSPPSLEQAFVGRWAGIPKSLLAILVTREQVEVPTVLIAERLVRSIIKGVHSAERSTQVFYILKDLEAAFIVRELLGLKHQPASAGPILLEFLLLARSQGEYGMQFRKDKKAPQVLALADDLIRRLSTARPMIGQ